MLLQEKSLTFVMIVYGIRNCDTVKKAVAWFDDKHVPFEFYDYRTRRIPEEKLCDWVAQAGWEALVNRRGTTWPAVQSSIVDAETAIALMKKQPSVIRRPIVEVDGRLLIIGFDEAEYTRKFR